MQTIPIAKAEAEMVLAKDVRLPDNPDGPPLCGAGVVLTLSLIIRLRDKGIQSLTVEGHPVWLEGDLTLEEQLAALDRRFKKVASNPRMLTLKDIYRAQILRSMGEPDER
jgi:hypothetical protein